MRKTKTRTLTETRIQRAVCGFIIPMMTIPKLYRALEIAVAANGTEADLKRIIAQFPGVEVAR